VIILLNVGIPRKDQQTLFAEFLGRPRINLYADVNMLSIFKLLLATFTYHYSS